MQITFILSDNSEKSVPFSTGQTILQVAEENNISLRHNCEGFGVCGSCHVIIEGGYDKLQKITAKETTSLDLASGVTSHSRLACQTFLSEENDGIRVRIP